MFQSILSNLKSWAIKIFLGIIALSFAVWGVGDIFRSNSDPIVASIGDTNIRASEVSKGYSRELDKLRQMSGGEIDAEQARSLGVVESTLQNIINRASLDEQSRDLAMGVPDTLIAREIRSSSKFRNEAGDFDPRIFKYVVAQNGMDEETFIAMFRADILRTQLVDTLISGIRPPGSMIDAVSSFRGEKREAQLVIIDGKDLTGVPTPSESDLYTYHEANKKLFMEPEYRTISYAAIQPADLFDEIVVSEDAIQSAYEYRIDDFVIPDQVDLDMVVLPTEEIARSALNRMHQGEDFTDVAIDQTGLAEADIELGLVSSDKLLPEISEMVFNVNSSVITEPVKSDFGWHLIKVNQVVPGRALKFSEVSENIRNELRIEEAIDLVFDLSDRLEDELASGSTLEAAARSLGIPVSRAKLIDAEGFTFERKRADSLPTAPGFLEKVFSVDLGTDVPIFEAPGNILLKLRVDEIVPPAVQQLEKVRAQVALAWESRWRDEQAKKLANEFKRRASESSFVNAVEEYKLIGLEGNPFTRNGVGLEFQISGDAVQAIFELEVDEATEPIKIGEGKYAVATLTDIIPLQEKDTAARASLESELIRSMQNDLLITVQNALRGHYGLKVDERLLNNLF